MRLRAERIFRLASVRVDRTEIVFSNSFVTYACRVRREIATSCAPGPVGTVASTSPEAASNTVTSPASRLTTQTVPLGWCIEEL